MGTSAPDPTQNSKEAATVRRGQMHRDVAAGSACRPVASSAPLSHFPIMHSDFSLFRERLAHACRVRSMTHDHLCASIGLGSRRRVDLAFSGLKALDVYRLAQIAVRLEVVGDERQSTISSQCMRPLASPAARCLSPRCKRKLRQHTGNIATRFATKNR